jgi:exopolysaccharide/PEP-CTERM locus tyrosine autokinase
MSIIEKAADRLEERREKPRMAAPQIAALETETFYGQRPAVVVDLDALRSAGFLAPEDYERQLAEEYRRIKRPLLANAFGIGAAKVSYGNLIMIGSALPGEGKTHTCINLALSIAMEKDRTVLLVDGDVAKPTISSLFGVEDQPGLLDALEEGHAGLHQMLLHTDLPRLRLLPAGRPRPSATELLASDRMRELCHELSERYPDRIVLFDSPPLLSTSEASAIAAAVGQVALVVASGLTPRSAVRHALDHVRPEQAVNVILNKQRQVSQGGYYGYGYGYGQPQGDGDAAAS